MKLLSTVRGAPATNGALLRATVPRTLGQSSEGRSRKAQAEATHRHRQDSHSGLQSLNSVQNPAGTRDKLVPLQSPLRPFSMKTPRLASVPIPASFLTLDFRTEKCIKTGVHAGAQSNGEP